MTSELRSQKLIGFPPDVNITLGALSRHVRSRATLKLPRWRDNMEGHIDTERNAHRALAASCLSLSIDHQPANEFSGDLTFQLNFAWC